MRPSKTPELKFLLALLPFFIEGAPFFKVFTGIIFCTFLVFGAVQFFNLTAPLFPKKFLRFSLVLLIAAIYQAANYHVEIPALWIAGFFLLFDWNDIDPNRLGAKSLSFWPRLAAFAGCGMTLVLVREMLARQTGALIFHQPSGTLALFAFTAFLFPKLVFLKLRDNG